MKELTFIQRANLLQEVKFGFLATKLNNSKEYTTTIKSSNNLYKINLDIDSCKFLWRVSRTYRDYTISKIIKNVKIMIKTSHGFWETIKPPKDVIKCIKRLPIFEILDYETGDITLGLGELGMLTYTEQRDYKGKDYVFEEEADYLERTVE